MASEIYVYPYETTVEEKYMDEGGYGRTRNVKRIYRGITLRDQLAMSALNGLLSYSAVNPMSGNYHENCTCDNAAQAAYDYADAMLKARGTI